MVQMRRIGGAHEREIAGGLSPEEYATLSTLLGKVAEAQGLTAYVHPGYRAR